MNQQNNPCDIFYLFTNMMIRRESGCWDVRHLALSCREAFLDVTNKLYIFVRVLSYF